MALNLQELKALVGEGESEHVEFKRSTGQRTDADRTVCGMLNGQGGIVLFGVDDKGVLLGQRISRRTMEDIANEMRGIEPPAFPDIETVMLHDGIGVVGLRVPALAGSYTYDGRAYLQQGPTTRIMPREEFERRLIERLHSTRRWENESVPDGVGIADLDTEEIETTLAIAINGGRMDRPRKMGVRAILVGLGLIVDGRLLNTAVALYGKSKPLESIYPQFALRMARFRGAGRLADYADNRQYWGSAFALLQRAASFLLDHVPIASRVISGKMERLDRPLYPPRANREALANAFCHRDCSAPGGAVALAMYDGRLEIANPGAFHFGMTPEKLTRPHESKPWNPIIASVFYRAGIIERWGSGTLNILDWCKEKGNPRPSWAERAGSVVLTFKPNAAATWAAAQVTARVTATLAAGVASRKGAEPAFLRSAFQIGVSGKAWSEATLRSAAQGHPRVIGGGRTRIYNPGPAPKPPAKICTHSANRRGGPRMIEAVCHSKSYQVPVLCIRRITGGICLMLTASDLIDATAVAQLGSELSNFRCHL